MQGDSWQADGPTSDHTELEAFEASRGIDDNQALEALAASEMITQAHGIPPYPSKEEASGFVGSGQLNL
jgi:hypothetical protein